MEYLHKEYTLSLYGSLANLKNSPKSAVYLVQNQLNGKIYIKKELKTYKIDVYKAMQEIKHKNTPRIYEVIELNNTLYIIEEFINGNTLEEVLKEQGPLDETIVIKHILEVCNILEILHNRNVPIIHRDIKPSNIIISNDNVVKLIDFDVSRTYKEESREDTHILGTKGYASPEQFGFEQTDCRSDIYSLGIMMNVLTTGDYPKINLNQGRLKGIIEKCTEIAAEKRYFNIEELKLELESVLLGKEVIKEKTIQQNEQLESVENLGEYTKSKKNILKSFLKDIPGFRSKNKIKMVSVSLWYAFLFFGITTSFENFSIGLLWENTLIVILLLSLTFLFGNYKDIQSRLPLLNSKDKKVKIIGMGLYPFILFLICGLLMELF